MGLLDILNGMQNGPRGRRRPKSSGSSGGMSPIMMALLGLLAYKALKGRSGQAAAPGGMSQPGPLPSGATTNAGNTGGARRHSGRVARRQARRSTHWCQVRRRLGRPAPWWTGWSAWWRRRRKRAERRSRQSHKGIAGSGHGRVAQSWVGTGANEEIAPNDLASALGGDTLVTLSQQAGIGHEDLLAGLSQHLPDLINQLTPHGRLPTEEEALRMV